MAFTKEDVSKIYVATFNRAPDSTGLDYWVNSSGFTNIEDVAKSFFDSPEAQAIYTKDKAPKELVNLAYQNLFGRDAETDGLNYWVERLESGAISQSLMLQALINGALGNDKTIMDNKTEVGLSFATAGLDDVSMAKEIMSNVTSSSSSVQDALSTIASLDTSFTTELSSLSNLNTFGVSAVYSKTKWDDSFDTITYSFNSSIPNDYYDYSDSGNDGVLVNGWTSLNDEQQDATRAVMKELDALVDVNFQEVSSDGMIELNMVDMDANTAGFSFYPGNDFSYDGDVFLSTDFNKNSSDFVLTPGGFGHETIAHELGHAMGLKHPFEGEYTLPTSVDDVNHSIMSYTSVNNYIPIVSFSSSKIFIDYKEIEPQSYSLYDVAALQAVYGANTTTHTEDNTYTIKYQDYKIQTIWDAGGVDTIDLTGTIGNSTIDLRSGTVNSADQYTLADVIEMNQKIALDNGKEQHNDWIAENITNLYNDGDLYTGINNLGIAQGVVIENLYSGLGDDIITDNEVNNIISTSGGDDKIYEGNGGNDVIDGGDGEDTIYLDIAKDKINSFSVDGSYYALQTDSFKLDFTDIEHIELSGIIYSPDDLLT